MSERVLYLPDRFRAAARYYTTGRPAYPNLLSRRVADLIGLDGQASVLDVGTGPGFLAIDLAPYARTVTGLDPSTEMLAVAADNAARAGVEIDWVHGSSYDLGPHFGSFRLATFGRSFHWTDREKTLETLEGLIEDGGAVALYSDHFPNVPQNAWYAPYSAVLAEHGNDDPARADRRASTTHETVLLASSFDHLERVAVLERRLTPVEHFVDRALSFGKAWNGSTVPQADELELRIRSVLASHTRADSTIEEIVEGRALVARRSRDQRVSQQTPPTRG